MAKNALTLQLLAPRSPSGVSAPCTPPLKAQPPDPLNPQYDLLDPPLAKPV